MTIIEKIQNLTWWNEISKLKDILTSLFTNTENIDTRVTNIENNPSPPQVLQDLKSVVDTGGYAWKDNEFNYISLLNGTAYDRSIGWDIYQNVIDHKSTDFISIVYHLLWIKCTKINFKSPDRFKCHSCGGFYPAFMDPTNNLYFCNYLCQIEYYE